MIEKMLNNTDDINVAYRTVIIAIEADHDVAGLLLELELQGEGVIINPENGFQGSKLARTGVDLKNRVLLGFVPDEEPGGYVFGNGRHFFSVNKHVFE
jgi:hypothetical protein